MQRMQFVMAFAPTDDEDAGTSESRVINGSITGLMDRYMAKLLNLATTDEYAIALLSPKLRKFYLPAIKVAALLYKLDSSWISKVRGRKKLEVRKKEVALAMHGWLVQLDDSQYAALREALGVEVDERTLDNSRDTLLSLCTSVLDGTATGRPMTGIMNAFKKLVGGAFGIVLGKSTGDPKNTKWPLDYSMYMALVDVYKAGCLKSFDTHDWMKTVSLFRDEDDDHGDSVEDALEHGVHTGNSA